MENKSQKRQEIIKEQQNIKSNDMSCPSGHWYWHLSDSPQIQHLTLLSPPTPSSSSDKVFAALKTMQSEGRAKHLKSLPRPAVRGARLSTF